MPEDVTKLYNFMDANGDGFISLNEMKLLLEGSQESVKDRMKSFSPEFDLQMKTNIKKNFDKLDKNNSGSLDPEEFHSFFAPYTNDMAVTLEKAR
jgi:Ca2+-binding EF-hand superfamily protein